MISYNLTRKERNIFNVAKSVSKTSDYDGVSVGCVVTYKNTIISVASNSNKTHPLQKIYNRFRDFNEDTADNKLHAEVHALALAKNVFYHTSVNWSDVSIYVYREWKDGTPAVSKPCVSCSKLIEDLGIRTVFYIDEQGRYVKERNYQLRSNVFL